MSDAKTIEFLDGNSQDQGVAIVRNVPSFVGLALSLARDGDIEVFLSPSDARRLIDALAEAAARAGQTN